MAFQVNDQVIVKKKMPNCNRIQVGSIVDIRGEAYVVKVAGEPRSRTVSESELVSIGDMYPGRKIVDHVAARRGNFKPYRQT